MLNDQTYNDHFDSLLLDHNTEQHSQDTELRACIGKQAHPRQHDTTHPSQLISAGTPTRCLHTPPLGPTLRAGLAILSRAVISRSVTPVPNERN